MDYSEIINDINLRSSVVSTAFIVWAYVALTISALAGAVAWKHRKNKDTTYKFASALCLTWAFDGAVRLWYTSLNFFRATDAPQIVEWMINSYTPAVLALGVILGGLFHVKTLVLSYNGKGRVVWKWWIRGLITVVGSLLATYFLEHFHVLEHVLTQAPPM